MLENLPGKFGMSTILNATEVTVRYNERAILDAAKLAILDALSDSLILGGFSASN